MFLPWQNIVFEFTENKGLNRCSTTSYFYRVGKIKVLKKLLGQQDLYFLQSELGNYSLKSPTTVLKIRKNSLEQPFIMEIRNRVMQLMQRFKTKVLINFTTWLRLCNTSY